MYPELGLTPATFFESLTYGSLRQFIDPRVLNVLDPLFGEDGLPRSICRRVALALVDLHAILGEGEGRQLVLGLVP